MIRTLLNIIFIFALSLAPRLSSASTSEQAPESTYAVRGAVKVVDLSHRRATISHERIPGYMEAMTMDFEVRDGDAIKAIHAGETIDFRLHVAGSEAWIDEVRKNEREPAEIDLRAAEVLEPEFKIGAKFPDLAMVDEFGAPRELKAYRGKALAVTFIYTRCPLPTYCPLINRNFQAVQAILKEAGKRNCWSLLSISLDPEYDTSEKLKDFADAERADASCWLFLNAERKQATSAARAIGLEFVKKDAQFTHNLRTVVLDSEGCIRRIFRGNEWTPQELAAEMMSAMRGMKPDAAK